MSGIASPDMLYTAIVNLVAVLLYIWMGINVGRMRGRHGIKAPAMTGHDQFERAVRIHLNTLEWAVVFIPALWIAEIWFGGWLPPVLGAIWVIGRAIYMIGYMAAPERRETGFLIQALAALALIILAFWGVIASLLIVA